MTADTPALRKARGAFFTPSALTEYITAWAIRSRDDTVLEPSAGEAAFLTAAATRLRELGGHADAEQLHGAELHRASAEAALAHVRASGADATMHVGDFLEQPAEPRWTAVIGNPPYVRYQDFSGTARAAGQRAALAAGVRISGLASAWAPFVVHAAECVAPGGRLGLVLPAELLTVSYAAEVRRYLLRRFADVRLVMFEQRVFPGVMEEVVLLLAEGVGPTDHFRLYQARNAEQLADAEQVSWVQSTPEGDASWTPALLLPSSFDTYRQLIAGDAFTTLHEGWGKAGLGAVTGNNRWFTLTTARARELQLDNSELVPISPPGSRHLRGLTFAPAAWKALGEEGRAVHLFYPRDEPSLAARRYIQQGEEAAVHEAYKCRTRRPWWRVPLAPKPDLLLTYMNHIVPQMTTNSARVRHINSIHGVVLHRGRKKLGQDLLPLAALNSVSLLGAEMVGRAYGGGMLKLEPREADRWPMPAPALVETSRDKLKALKPQLTMSLRRGDLLAASQLVDGVLLREAGLKQADVKAIRDARRLLFGRREARGSS